MSHTPLQFGPLPVEDPPWGDAPPPDPDDQPSHPSEPAEMPQPLIIIDLTAWPQVQARLPVAVPVTLLIQALELTLGQLRELYIQSQVQRMRT